MVPFERERGRWMVPKMFPRGQREPEGRKRKETWEKKSARAEKRGVGREGHKECQFSSEVVGRLESFDLRPSVFSCSVFLDRRKRADSNHCSRRPYFLPLFFSSLKPTLTSHPCRSRLLVLAPQKRTRWRLVRRRRGEEREGRHTSKRQTRGR